MIRIQIKNGDIDAALDKFKAAKNEQNRKFDAQLDNLFSPKVEEQPEPQPVKKAPSYQSLLSRSRRAG